MMQGDAYNIPFVIKKADGSVVRDVDVLDVEIVLENLKKTAGEGQIRYENGQWLFPLAQEESFGFTSAVKGQVRIKWLNGEVEGCKLDRVPLEHSRSKEVL